MWQEVTNNIHSIDEKLAVFNTDMHMRTEDQQTLGEFLHVLLHTHVALLRGDLLGQPGGEWMCTRRDDLQTVLSGQLHDGAPQPHQFRSEFSRRLAHGRADLDHRLVQFGLDLLAYYEPTLLQNLGDAGPQCPRQWVD